MDLESVAEELYSGSPDDFVERRQQRVVDARAARDRALVKAIGALRRPTRSAWMVNLVARTSPDDVRRLADLGAALADAQRRASGPDLRRLAKERQATLDALTRSAVQLAADEGYSATESTRVEVSQTFQAALADPEVAELVRTGRVIQPATYGGFGPMDLGLLVAPTTTAESSVEGGTPSQTGATTGSDEPATNETATDETATDETATDETATDEPAAAEPEPPEEDPARVAAEAAVQAAEESRDLAATEARAAEQEADEATARADELADRVEELRTELEAAETAEREARTVARSARKREQQTQESFRVAEAEVAAARSALASAETS